MCGPYHVAPDGLRRMIATERTQPRFGPRLFALAAAVTMAVSLGGATAVRMVGARQADYATASMVEVSSAVTSAR